MLPIKTYTKLYIRVSYYKIHKLTHYINPQH